MRLWMSAGLAATVAAALFVPGWASGGSGSDPQLSRSDLLGVGLHVSDLPRALRPSEGGRTSVVRSGRSANGPDLCIDRDVDIVRGPRPRRHVAAVIPIAGSAQQLSITGTRSDIYQYPSAQRADVAFSRIKKTAKTCAFDDKVEMDAGGITLTADARGVVGRTSRLAGALGLTLLFRARAQAALPPLFDATALADRYSAYHLAGATIVRVAYSQAEAVDGKASLNAQRKKWVRQTAVTVAHRVLRLS